jgi:hypothetical protein
VALAGICASAAEARTGALVPHPPADVWPTAIRFLRVDRDYPIKEKDETAGYVLFDYLESKRVYRSALELIRATDAEGRPSTQVVFTVQDLPKHFESTLLDKLSAKIKEERGAAPPPPKKAPPPPPPAAPSGEGKDGKPPATTGSLPKPPTWGPPDGRSSR